MWGQGAHGTPQTRVPARVAGRLGKWEMVSEQSGECPHVSCRTEDGGGPPSWAEASILGKAAHLFRVERAGGKDFGEGAG